MMDPAERAGFALQIGGGSACRSGPLSDDAALHEMVDELCRASEEFGQLWAEHHVAAGRSGHKRVHHRALGWLDLDCEALHDPDRDRDRDRDRWMILYTAAPGTPAHDALQMLRVIGTQQLHAAP